jgi:hypothetical protein
MNCPQCQTPNGSDAAFCGNCGAGLTPAGAPAQPGGYTSSSGTPLAQSASGPAAPGGYDAPPSYGGPAGYPPAGGYPPPMGQAPGGQPPAYQPGTSGGFSQRASSLPPVKFDLGRLTTVDKIVAVASLVTMISLWLPWFTASYQTVSGSISGTGYHGWLWLEFFVALILIAYLVARAAWDQLPFNLPVAHAPLLIVGTALQFLLVVIGFFDTPPTDNLAGYSVGWGFGAFLALIASIVAAGPVIYPAVRSYLESRNAAGGVRQ